MSAEEKIGKVLLLPVKVIAILICIPLLIVMYPFVGIYVFINTPGSIKKRLVMAVCWPLALLALNDFLSLGGLDNPFLTRVNNWLSNLDNKKSRKES